MVEGAATRRLRVCLRALLFILAISVLAAFPAAALDRALLDSVVGVLPEWPDTAQDESVRRQRREEPEGSGVAIRPGGYLVTNFHVVRRAAAVSVRLADGRILPAEVIGRDPPTDLAVLRVKAELPPLPAGPEPTLGARVCTIGNQFGLGLSVTCGVVSAVHRTGVGFNPIEDYIQTDAVVNPGASGGALVDAKGRLVGIVSAIFTKRSDANIGVNFATTLPLVMRVVDDLIVHGRVRRARSGLRVADLDRAERATLVGARVTRVLAGSPGQAAGVKTGDTITAIGPRRVRRASDVPSALGRYRPGDRVPLRVDRDGRTKTLTLELTP